MNKKEIDFSLNKGFLDNRLNIGDPIQCDRNFKQPHHKNKGEINQKDVTPKCQYRNKANIKQNDGINEPNNGDIIQER